MFAWTTLYDFRPLVLFITVLGLYGRLFATAGEVQRPAPQDAEVRLRQEGQPRPRHGELLRRRPRLRRQE